MVAKRDPSRVLSKKADPVHAPWRVCRALATELERKWDEDTSQRRARGLRSSVLYGDSSRTNRNPYPHRQGRPPAGECFTLAVVGGGERIEIRCVDKLVANWLPIEERHEKTTEIAGCMPVLVVVVVKENR